MSKRSAEPPKSRPAGPPTSRGELTRGRLLEAAEFLFTRVGYEATGMVEIAERAGVGVGTVYHHFRDKRALLLELVDVALERSRERAHDLPVGDLLAGRLREGPRGIERWLRRAYDYLRKHPTLSLVLLAQSAGDPELRLRKERSDRLRIERLAALIALGQEQGIFRRDHHAASAAFVIHHAVDAAAMQLLVREVRDPSPDTVLAELGKMLSHYLLEDARGDELANG